MKIKEFMQINGCKDYSDLQQFFRNNLHAGILPVAVYVCPRCEEVIDELLTHQCSE
jgi:hypothetical protein